jgi:N-hydroxyarylamine O-acetyltransferase
MLDFDAYLERIGLRAGNSPTWQGVHRAHATSIPFENLDSHRGMPISLEQQDLERKMVGERRGGYCFEHNLLLASALEHHGLRVEPMLARVRVGGAPPEALAYRPPCAAGHRRRRQEMARGRGLRPWHAA